MFFNCNDFTNFIFVVFIVCFILFVLLYELTVQRMTETTFHFYNDCFTGKSISPELAERVCVAVDNHSSYVQQLAWLIWVITDKVATEKEFEEASKDILDQNTPLFEKQTENLSTYQMNFLRAVIAGVRKEFSTQEVIQKYKLGSSANVVMVKRALVKKELIETEKREVFISDPLLKIWLQRELQ